MSRYVVGRAEEEAPEEEAPHRVVHKKVKNRLSVKLYDMKTITPVALKLHTHIILDSIYPTSIVNVTQNVTN